MSTHKRAHGFTLIELLVVVTIIVILLALLMPAMDKAIYQAELAVCGANLKSVATGALSYATGHKRRYPDRFSATSSGYCAEYLKFQAANDDRPKIMPFIDLKTFVDPLCVKVDLGMAANDADTIVSSNYALFFGHRFYSSKPEPGMFRVGDPIIWGTERFNVLAMDSDRIIETTKATSSHPDGQKLTPSVWQNRDQIQLVYKHTLSRWEMNGNHTRGAVDYNAVFQDGGIRRYRDVAYNEWDKNRAPRFTRVPFYGTSAATEYRNMPLD